ncbi:hypothetical protein PG991_012258 [Apiospora marii]|uniref:Uncharacterized protein n=1 Tax=Apiospora marii TaxID=335849 RepID=A0ABR1R9C8_9PEZI
MEPSTASMISTTSTARAGAALSRTLFELLSTASYSPREVYEVATAVVDLSVALDDLYHIDGEWRSMGPGIKMKRELERQVASALECINTLYGEIRALIDPANAAARLLWAFRRARWRSLLWEAEIYKAGVWTIMTTMSLACRLHSAVVYVPI